MLRLLPLCAASLIAASSAWADAPADRPTAASWESGTTSCGGMTAIRFDFQDSDAEGRNMRLRAQMKRNPDYVRWIGQITKNPDGDGWIATLEPVEATTTVAADPNANPGADPSVLRILIREKFSGARLSARFIDLGCRGETLLGRADPEEADLLPEASVASLYAPMTGWWDGVALDPRGADAIPLSLEVRSPSASAGDRVNDGRVLEASLFHGSVEQAATLVPNGDAIKLDPITKGPRTLDMRLLDPVASAQSGVIAGVMQGRDPKFVYLWRRDPAQDVSLIEICSGRVAEWLRAGHSGLSYAWALKEDFYPALVAFDAASAARRESTGAALTVFPNSTNADLAGVLALCALTAPQMSAFGDGVLIQDFLDVDALLSTRAAMSQRADASLFVLPAPSPSDRAAAGEAIAGADAQMLAASAQVAPGESVERILADVEDLGPLINAARPSVSRLALAQLSAALDSTNREALGSARAALRAAASERMASVVRPDAALLGKRGTLLDSIGSGEIRSLQKDEMGFLGGMIAAAADRCDMIDAGDLYVLSGLAAQGWGLAFGSETSNPNLMDVIESQFSGAQTYDEGVAFVEKLGCDSQYLAALMDTLVISATNRYRLAGTRAPLFERSCANTYAPQQCKCLMPLIETYMPGVSQLRYDRTHIQTAIAANPLIGVNIYACGISN